MDPQLRTMENINDHQFQSSIFTYVKNLLTPDVNILLWNLVFMIFESVLTSCGKGDYFWVVYHVKILTCLLFTYVVTVLLYLLDWYRADINHPVSYLFKPGMFRILKFFDICAVYLVGFSMFFCTNKIFFYVLEQGVIIWLLPLGWIFNLIK
jgi:hypothetical protein